MSIRIAHLSDLHFGKKFNLALWRAVKAQVAQFGPQVLVVSGDLVDDPSPIQLLAAKRELRALAEAMRAKLVVVPGNHDVYGKGNFRPRRDWFERVFFNEDTRMAEERAEQDYGEPALFSERFRINPKPSVGLLERLKRSLGSGQPFTSFLPPAKRQDLVQRPEGCSVLIATLDSNKAGQPVGFATGWVDDDDLTLLGAELAAISDPYLVRIAVVHHHLLPIAFTGGAIIGAEPFMVLHNAGTVLNLLTRHRFDLVLHGHKHVAQFARLDLSPKDETGHTMTVVAAGSCALETENDPAGNCFNLITVLSNGQIDVESFSYGGGTEPSRDGYYSIYREPSTTAKRRALIRARERHRLHCRSRTQIYQITETGDLLTEATLVGLSTKDTNPTHRRVQGVSLPPDSWFVDSVLMLDRDFSSPGVALKIHPEQAASNSRGESRKEFTVSFPEDTLRNTGVSYRVRYACGNNISMSQWECTERKNDPPDDYWDKGFVGFGVTHPIDILEMNLHLPQSLQDVSPFLQCLRPQRYPSYEIDANGDVIFAGIEFDLDSEMTRHESEALKFDRRKQCWCLRIEKPLVGYNYKIVWDTPPSEENLPIQAEVSDQRKIILSSFSARTSNASSWPPKIADVFLLFASQIERLLSRCVEGEKRSVELFVYDGQARGLRPFLAHRSWTGEPLARDFVVPLGCGIAGVAFRQGRIIPWAMQERRSPFIKPVPYVPGNGEPAIEMRNILAVPIFHASQIHRDRPPPWACMGVACFASSSDGTKIASLFQPAIDDDINQLLHGIRGLAYATMDRIVSTLEHPNPAVK